MRRAIRTMADLTALIHETCAEIEKAEGWQPNRTNILRYRNRCFTEAGEAKRPLEVAEEISTALYHERNRRHA